MGFSFNVGSKDFRIRTGLTTPIVIALVGIDGVERDHFLEALVYPPLLTFCDNGLVPPTTRVIKGVAKGQQVWLVDTPPATVSDAEMLEAVIKALDHEVLEGETTLHGIICLHDINDTNIKDTADKNLAKFKKLLAPTLGGNIMVVTTLWDGLGSAVQGFQAEFELKAIYASSLPAITVSRVEGSWDGENEDLYLGMVQDLVSRVKSLKADQESVGRPQGTPVNMQLHKIIDKKNKELASLQAELGAMKDTLDGQSLELKKLTGENEGLGNELQQLKTKLEQQEARFSAETGRLKQQLINEQEERQNLIDQVLTWGGGCCDGSENDEDKPPKRPSVPQQKLSPTIRQQKQQQLDPSLNKLDSRGEFPLYRAAAGGHYDEVKQLLDQGADASMCTCFDWTALHWASGNGHPKVVELLLSHGANANARSDTGRKPLGMARTDEIRQILLKHGAT